MRPIQDHASFIIGKIFDRPLRSWQEEAAFIVGAGQEEEENVKAWREDGQGGVDWEAGRGGALDRLRRLEQQFPLHDVEPAHCHALSPAERDKMSSYIENVKQNIAGQGVVARLAGEGAGQEVGQTPPERLARGVSGSPPPPPMPPPMQLLPISPLQYQAGSGQGWSCSGCEAAMLPGQPAVFAERAGADRCWHPACFSCSQCGEMLQDLLYYYASDRLFCARHFASLMKIPRCSGCDELIFSREFTAAEGRMWHVKHFCCWTCDRALAGEQYIAVEGMPHCLPCWQARHGKQCRTCLGEIAAREQRVTVGELHWHARPACFQCGVCGASLLGGKLAIRQDTAVCSSTCATSLLSSKPGQRPSLALSHTSSRGGTIV